MKARSLLSVAGALLVAAVAARAAEPKTYKVRFDDVWKVGDVVTREAKETETTDIVVKQADGKVVQDQKGTVTTSYRIVEKCLAAEGGRSTRRLLYFHRWSVQGEGSQGPVKDESLAGTHVEVTGSGASRSWKVLTPGKEISDVAKTWLAKKFADPSVEAARALLSPKDPVAPGATWKVDLAQFVKTAGESVDVDPQKSAIEVGFLGVEPTKAGEYGRYSLDVHLHTRTLQGPQGRLPWREGGTLRQKGVMRRSLAEGAFDEERAVETTLTGVAEGDQNALVTFQHKTSEQEAVGGGGEMPPGPVVTTPAPLQAPAN